MPSRKDYGSKGQTWHPDFVAHMEFIAKHPNYAGMPDGYASETKIQWEAPSNRGSGKFKDTHHKRRDCGARCSTCCMPVLNPALFESEVQGCEQSTLLAFVFTARGLVGEGVVKMFGPAATSTTTARLSCSGHRDTRGDEALIWLWSGSLNLLTSAAADGRFRGSAPGMNRRVEPVDCERQESEN
jgi:hypothetical protein